MGNKLLIKSVAMALSSVVLLYGEITISDIDRLVNDIKMEREGLKEVEIQKAKDPFIYPNGKYRKVLQSAASKSKRKYRFYLTAIINDSVKINNRWYRLNSKINGYKVSKVGKNYVLLTKNSERVRVFLKHPKSKKIKLIVK